MRNNFLFTLIGACLTLSALAQPEGNIIDKPVAWVGDDIVTLSDLENQRLQYIRAGNDMTDNVRCTVLEELLFQKLLITQAKLDSVEVSESQIQQEIDRRLRYFIQLAGSEERLEQEYEKSIDEIKAEFHDLVKDQLLVQQMQATITDGVEVTPSEVKVFFEEIHQDSVPFIEAEVELSQIVRKPPISKKEIDRVKRQLNGFIERVKNGENFGTLAYLYSDDKASARENGDLGWLTRTQLVPEFAAVAFNLGPGELSEIVETEYGYHIIEGGPRKGDQINCKHILIRPKVSADDLAKARKMLDSLATELRTKPELNFGDVAGAYSQDKDSRNSRGSIMNPMTGTPRFEVGQLGQIDPSLVFIMDKMEVGDVSDPGIYDRQDGSKAYRIIKLVSTTEPHRANLKQDYQRLHDIALMKKQEKVFQDWVSGKIGGNYVRIDDKFKQCEFEHNWEKLPQNN